MSKELKTGIVSLLIIALGIWGFNFLKGQTLFSATARKFKAVYNNIEGLSEASIVTISGMQVGKVTKISFHPEQKGKVLVEFTVDNDFEFAKNSEARIYAAGLMGGQNIAIIPKYQGDKAVSGDLLPSSKESGMLASVTQKLDPVTNKVEGVLLGADSLLLGLNQILDVKAQKSLNRSVIGLEFTIRQMKKTLSSVNTLLDQSKSNIQTTLDNTKKITTDFSKVSSDLSKTDLSKTVLKLESTLAKVNSMLVSLQNGQGTLGKLLKDDKMYTNLTNASKEMEELLREMKLNPKRFVHFSLFGKKPKPYNQEKNNSDIIKSQKKTN